jgi:hypothetical protein
MAIRSNSECFVLAVVNFDSLNVITLLGECSDLATRLKCQRIFHYVKFVSVLEDKQRCKSFYELKNKEAGHNDRAV